MRARLRGLWLAAMLWSRSCPMVKVWLPSTGDASPPAVVLAQISRNSRRRALRRGPLSPGAKPNFPMGCLRRRQRGAARRAVKHATSGRAVAATSRADSTPQSMARRVALGYLRTRKRRPADPRRSQSIPPQHGLTPWRAAGTHAVVIVSYEAGAETNALSCGRDSADSRCAHGKSCRGEGAAERPAKVARRKPGTDKRR